MERVGSEIVPGNTHVDPVGSHARHALSVGNDPQSQAQYNSSEIKIPYVMSLLAGYGLSGGSPQGIREELAKQEGRIREAISTWPLAPRSGSLSGYREIYDVSRGNPVPGGPRASRRPTAGSRAWRVCHRSGDIFRISRLPFCSRCCRCA
jgi:cytochrome bd-type quinol oxidase subunit 1